MPFESLDHALGHIGHEPARTIIMALDSAWLALNGEPTRKPGVSTSFEKDRATAVRVTETDEPRYLATGVRGSTRRRALWRPATNPPVHPRRGQFSSHQIVPDFSAFQFRGTIPRRPIARITSSYVIAPSFVGPGRVRQSPNRA